VPSYAVNEEAIRRAKRLIDARQYVLRSRWQNVQPRAREQNAFLKTHTWEEYAAWHLGLTDGAPEETKARYALSTATSAVCTDGTDRLSLPNEEWRHKEDRACSTRSPPIPRPKERLTTGQRPRLVADHRSVVGGSYAAATAPSTRGAAAL
jgi:hypothetical protein